MGQRAPAGAVSTLLGYSGNPAGVTKEERAVPERALSGPLEPQILQDDLTLSLAEVLQVSLPPPSNKEVHPYCPVTLPNQMSQDKLG